MSNEDKPKRGRGRPPKDPADKVVAVSLCLPANTYNMLRHVSLYTKKPISYFLREGLRNFFDNPDNIKALGYGGKYAKELTKGENNGS